jgi:threonine/homoserine/homoserine lactone efflux protein
MPFETIVAFAGAFFLLAASPGPGLAAILSRALGNGVASGLAVTGGLVIGDAIFLGVAMIGLSAIASTMGPLFQIVKYAGAAYLIWLGMTALRASNAPVMLHAQTSTALWRDVMLGLVVTLGNPKPILFYGALLPTFLDLSAIGPREYVTLMAVVIAVMFGVCSAYILMVDRARHMLAATNAAKRLNQATGLMFIGSGLVVASR